MDIADDTKYSHGCVEDVGASETPARSNSPEGRVHAEVYVRNATSATRTINDIASLLTVHAAIDGVWAIASD